MPQRYGYDDRSQLKLDLPMTPMSFALNRQIYITLIHQANPRFSLTVPSQVTCSLNQVQAEVNAQAPRPPGNSGRSRQLPIRRHTIKLEWLHHKNKPHHLGLRCYQSPKLPSNTQAG
ncbi:hypothetical protein RRG08_003291 [Elysia crispata]|uniref:Uncharacterized protein n=1 Tax=Elysia crispata TaxID=231223 RepID=A0AAE1D0L4_9GAST|nr:hypothetical protein RRG08_003291 [Elysia crispata]